MEFVREEPAIVDRFATVAGAGRVATLEDEVGDEPVEDRVGVVAVEAELEKVAGGEGCLDSPEFDVKVAVGSFEDYLCTEGGGGVCVLVGGVGNNVGEKKEDVLCLGLEVVAGSHCRGGYWRYFVAKAAEVKSRSGCCFGVG